MVLGPPILGNPHVQKIRWRDHLPKLPLGCQSEFSRPGHPYPFQQLTWLCPKRIQKGGEKKHDIQTDIQMIFLPPKSSPLKCCSCLEQTPGERSSSHAIFQPCPAIKMFSTGQLSRWQPAWTVRGSQTTPGKETSRGWWASKGQESGSRRWPSMPQR